MRVRTAAAAARGRKVGAGPKYGLVFTDRVLVMLVHLRIGLIHEALGVIYEVGSSTIGRVIGEIRRPGNQPNTQAALPGGQCHAGLGGATEASPLCPRNPGLGRPRTHHPVIFPVPSAVLPLARRRQLP
ncbi:transposase family protein [Streptomyces sp. NPDC102406]|uniref:transposase family protein n=1 Tax=Streptomyces sp. NPDC102406 TaxID=3366171 RepID=UPI00382F6857